MKTTQRLAIPIAFTAPHAWIAPLFLICVCLQGNVFAQTGTWSSLTNGVPVYGTSLLLTDGSVMVMQDQGTACYRLKPDASGSYINGTWTQLASMNDSRLYFFSVVLPDGRVLVGGGEYGTGTSAVERYDPVANTWTRITSWPGGDIGDSTGKVLPNGTVMVLPRGGGSWFYNYTTDVWTAGSGKGGNDEQGVTQMPDGNYLVAWDGSSQKFISSTGQWVAAATPPNGLIGPGSEIGPAPLLYDGRVFCLGANSNTDIYTESADPTALGTFVAGPAIPNGLACDDAPAAVMPNGHVLFAADHNNFTGPTSIFEYDPVANSYTDVGGGSGSPCYTYRMLVLPTGQVFLSDGQAQIYTPAGGPNAAWQPTISSITQNADGSYKVTGTQLNGLTEGAYYGDDAQMSSNYPIIRLVSGSTVYYAKSYGFSTMGVATGGATVSANFSTAGIPTGNYSLYVVANGVASAPFAFGSTTTFTISGTVTLSGSGLSGVTVSTGSLSATTDLNGNYTISGVANGTYTLTPSLSGYTFSPTSQSVTVSGANLSGKNFTASQIPVPPTITTQPANQTVVVGQTATFTVAASGTAPLSYQWQKGTSPISGATGSSYTTPPTAAGDNGTTYRCVVSNSAGIATSKSATLTVLSPTASATYIKTDTTTQGNWQGAYGPDGEAIQADSANYPAYATVAFNNASLYTWTSSTTDVRAPLKAASTTDRIASCWYSGSGAGTSFSIDLNLTDGQTHRISLYALDWDSSTRQQTFEIDDAGTGIALDGPRPLANYNGGEYVVWDIKGHVTIKLTCTGGYNAVLSAIFFGVINAVAPTITTQPANQTVISGQTATFSVAASGTAPLSYQWQENGSNIAGANSSSYTTPATSTADSGSTFRCIVSNSAGSATSNNATLTVNAANTPPTITSAAFASPNPALVSQTVAFVVAATDGDSDTLTYSWTFGDGGTGSGASISYAYATAGTYTATVTVNDGAGNSVTSSVSVTVSANSSGDTVWVEDSIPAGGSPAGDGGDGWNWVSSNPAPFSGSLANQSNIASGEHQHYFTGATDTLSINTGDTMIAYVYLDPANLPSEIMLQWNDGSWEHRAFWGADNIGWGASGTVAHVNMGALPAAGQWVRLQVPASAVGLEGSTLNGMAFTLSDGRATWDYAGKSTLSTPAITSASSVSGTVGSAFNYTITASNNPASYGAANLPNGLSVDPSTGIISGTPTAAGTSSVTISATNAAGTGSATLTLTINANVPPPPVINSALTATGTVGAAFSYTITATNSPQSFNATGLPNGLSVNTSTGVISGAPTAAGTSSIALSATNAGGTGTATLKLTVSATAKTLHVAAIAMSLSTTKTGKAATATVTVKDGNGAIVSSAKVFGSWSGLTTASVSGNTGSTGTVKFTTTRTKSTGTFTFTVTNITKTGYTYAPNQNAVTSAAITTSGTTPAAAPGADSAGAVPVSLGSVKANQKFKLALPLPEDIPATGVRSKAVKLPMGMRVSGAFIGGKPTKAGTYTFTVQFAAKTTMVDATSGKSTPATVQASQQYTLTVTK